jgi:hypothetical protein
MEQLLQEGNKQNNLEAVNEWIAKMVYQKKKSGARWILSGNCGPQYLY